MRYRLRTLMIVLALGPPLIAFAWFFLFDVLYAVAMVLLALLAAFVGLALVAGIPALIMLAILSPGIGVFYTASAVIRRLVAERR